MTPAVASYAHAGLGQNLHDALQLAVGAIFLLSSIPKLRDPRTFTQTVVDYKVIGAAAARVAAPGLIAVEGFLAISFLTGAAMDVGLAVAAATLVVFGVAIALNLRRGRAIDCGCFGHSGEQLSARSLVRVGALLAAVAVLAGTWVAGLSSIMTAAGLSAAGGAGLEYLVDIAGLTIVLLVTAAWVFVAPELVHVLRLAAGRPGREPATAGDET
jgi:hypothetical protein